MSGYYEYEKEKEFILECLGTPGFRDVFMWEVSKGRPLRWDGYRIVKFQRIGNQKKNLQGVERDEFVRKRVMAGFDKRLSTIRATVAAVGDGKPQGDSALATSVREPLVYFDAEKLDGVTVFVSGGQSFSEAAVSAAKKPKSLGNKVYLWQEDKALRKIIAAFGVDVSKFMFVPE